MWIEISLTDIRIDQNLTLHYININKLQTNYLTLEKANPLYGILVVHLLLNHI